MSTRSDSAEPSVHSIIRAARSVNAPSSSRRVWIATGISGLLLWASFPPLDWGPLGWIALVPLLILVRPAQRPPRAVLATYLTALVSQMCLVQWLRYGDPSMYLAMFACAIYFACYFPAFLLLCRGAVHRLRVPLVIAAPTIWVGLEYLRAYLFTGGSWYYLGHTQYRWLELIQISDLVGAYGVSFVVMSAAAALAGIVPLSWLATASGERANAPTNAESDPTFQSDQEEATAPSVRSSGIRFRDVLAVAYSVLLVGGCLVYGHVRRGQAEFHEGPRIALIQGDFTSGVKRDPSEASAIFNRHYQLTGAAVKYQPDLIVWPETMYRDPLFLASPDLSDAELLRTAPRIPPYAWRRCQVSQQLHDLSLQAGAGIIFGLDTLVADGGSLKHFNSAVLATPNSDGLRRYDKIHRMIFGEYIPARNWLPFLKALVPFEPGFELAAGDRAVAYDYKQWRLCPSICFEDTVPHLMRTLVAKLEAPTAGDKSVDCLVNVTNDGWFHGSAGLDQHLITALFRCVELRKPMVRAANTGISAVIDGDGLVIEPDVFIDADNKGRTSMRDPKTGRWNRKLNAVLIDAIPLDNRSSFYLHHGDWFAAGCGALAALAGVLALATGTFARRRPAVTVS
ncbi:MAG TPA: apolipoprotein N-acyltransferase [Planctomycetaceae bacterium]|jgi:apolipoprotein N-acyltransferase|nr:apolipoprotein N-acyltransferase [Planctomycetaceae bacterium]